jgi:ABC-type Mn2+/Zn2+ transport system ATPase subunit
VIVLQGLSARAGIERGKPDSRLANVSLEWERGVLAVLGTHVDGTTALLEALYGLVSPRAGAVRIFGKDPVEVRSRISYVPLEPALPDALRVDEVCELASRIRGETPVPAVSRLSLLGIEMLAPRRVRTLSRGETRAVSLAIALSSNAELLLLDEPLAGLDPAAPSRVASALRARAAAGAAIVVTTASVRDATALADQLGVLTHGLFTHLPPSLAHAGPGGARLRVVVAASATNEVAPLVSALAASAAVASIETASFAATRGSAATVAILVTGPDLLTLARAVGAAAATSGVDVEAIESGVMPLDAIRARVAVPRPGIVQARPSSSVPAAGATPAAPPPDSPPPPAPETP